MDALNILKTHLLDYLNPLIGIQLDEFLYHDVTAVDQLTTNNNGIDIIAQQVELKFSSGDILFLSWSNIVGWSTYSLTASSLSFPNKQKLLHLTENTGKKLLEKA